METYEEDREKIHQMIGLPYKKGKHENNMKEIVGSNYSTQDWTKLLFKNISLETKDQLRTLYKYDFEMFDYNPLMFD